MTTFNETKHGIGSYTLANGDLRYRVVYRVGRKVMTKAGFRSKGEAKAWQRHTLVALDKGEHIETSKARALFGDYAERWLERASDDPGIRLNTWNAYEYQYRVHVRPTFGEMEFRHLDTEAVRTWHTRMKATKKHGKKEQPSLSASTCAKVYRLFRRICEEAVEDGYLRHNPCRIKKAATEPKYVQAYEEPSDPAQVRALAAAVPERYRAMVLLAGFGGLRWGELCGLQRRHIDVKNATVRVEQQVVYVNGAMSIGPPKTEAGLRTVWVPMEVTAALTKHLNAFVESPASAHVFTGERGAWLRASNFRRRVWIPATETVGCPGVRFHDLRHAAATLAAMTGASTKDLMARMGHASQAAAIRYQHATKAQQKAIATRLDALLTEGENVVPIRQPKEEAS
jgi:integrase